MKWRNKEEGCKAKTQLSAGKVLMTIFRNFRGVLHIDLLHKHCTINPTYYCQLLDKVKLVYQQKRRSFLITVLHNNAKAENTFQTHKKSKDFFWTVTEQPPYSLTLINMITYSTHERGTWRIRFDNDTVVEMFVHNWLKTRPPSFLLITELKNYLSVWKNVS